MLYQAPSCRSSMTTNTDKADIIQAICDAVTHGEESEVSSAASQYPFTPPQRSGRKYTPLDATRIFIRDGFIDRYSGTRLINPGVLRLLSELYPSLFPFQKNWKMSETHPAYWELMPTIDHVVAVAKGGTDSEENWITTSMLRNSAKANWTVEELGWQVFPAGKLSDWDGLTQWLLEYVESHDQEKLSQYVKRWGNAARRIFKP